VIEYERATDDDPSLSVALQGWAAPTIETPVNGEVYVTIFSGPNAKERAQEYADWKNST